jgi:cellulose synthase (UDP-forming)
MGPFIVSDIQVDVADVVSTKRARQWGSERPRGPLPAVERPASHAATWMGGFAIVATVMLWLAYLRRTVLTDIMAGGFSDSTFIAQTVAYVLVMTLLTFSALMYLMARQGALYRSRTHHRVPRAEMDAHFGTTQASMTVLIPSYREDPDVVRSTMLSAALQEYPDLRVVLLIDDPSNPTDPDAIAGLAACRDLPAEVTELLRKPRERFDASLARHTRAARAQGPATESDLRALALDFVWAADWLDFESARYPRSTTTDDFVAQEVFGALGNDCRETAAALFAALDQRAEVPAERLVQLARRLAWTFSVEISSFERKTFAHLPHDANKAMNLNAYMGLMGGSYRIVDTRLGKVLRETDDEPDLVVPATEYVLTLDADSVLLREYCLRLVYHLELPGNERIAVIQTPYSAFRGAPTRLERIAGATTDTQFIVHQGLTYYGATFWVGANAVIRWEALKDLEEVEYVDGYPVRRYVQDRTVIEDTESSIDLIAKGWTLYNYPERLSYSATPPDFGSLVVQRARWANGGLLILPKLWHYMRAERKAGRRVRKSQVLLRFNYMASIAWASLGLVFLLAFPFNNRLLSPIILAAALPYFLAMGYDFHRMGYKRTDVFRVYAFNLILVPVNLAGTFKSLQQAAAKSKIPFARTPKVKDRTAAPALFILGAALIAGYSFYTLQHDLRFANWSNAVFAAFNGVLATYAIVAFIGVRNSVVDVLVGMAHWVQVPAKAVPADDGDEAQDEVMDWETMLYFGPGATEAGRQARGQGAAVTNRPPRTGERRSRVRTEVPS